MESAPLAVALAAALAGSSLDAVLARLRDRSDPAAQAEAASEVARRAGGLDAIDGHQAEAALEAAASDPFNAGAVRARALDALGRAAAASGDDMIGRRAVRALLDAPADQRLYALRGLTRAAPRLPADRTLREEVLGAALDALRDGSRPAERTQGAVLLDAALHGGNIGTLADSPSLSARFDAEVLGPLQNGGLDRLYDDPSQVEFRFYLMRSLAQAGLAVRSPNGVPQRARALLSRMADQDPDPRLRELARIYSGRYR